MLHEEIKKGIKEAMLAKDEVKLRAMRNVSAALTNEAMVKGKKPNEFLSDEEVTAVIVRLAKQRKDSIEQFRNGGRQDLVREEEAELAVLEKYLPQMMSQEEVEKVVKAKKEQMGIVDASQKGMLVGAVMRDLKGQADGSVVKAVVDSLF